MLCHLRFHQLKQVLLVLITGKHVLPLRSSVVLFIVFTVAFPQQGKDTTPAPRWVGFCRARDGRPARLDTQRGDVEVTALAGQPPPTGMIWLSWRLMRRL